MGHEFLNRVFRIAWVLSLGLGGMVAIYFGAKAGLDFTVSALWGTLSFRGLHRFVVEAFRPEGARWKRVLVTGLIRFPLLYGAGFLFVMWARPGAVAVLTGFSVVFMVIVLKALGRALIDSEWFRRPLVTRGGAR